MANQEQFFTNLSEQIGTLSNASGVLGEINIYDGDPKTFKDWLESREKDRNLVILKYMN